MYQKISNSANSQKSANYPLRNIEKNTQLFLDTDTTKSAIVSLVTSRLD